MISSRLLISPLPSLSIVSNRARSCASLSDVVAVEGFGAFVPLVVAFAFDTTATALLDDVECGDWICLKRDRLCSTMAVADSSRNVDVDSME